MTGRRAALAGIAALGAALVAAAPDRGDPVTRRLTSDDALEYWDFLAAFDGGVRLVARVLITNEGPGSRTAVSIGHLIRPGAEPVELRNGRLEDDWEIDPDGRKLKIGKTRLDLRGPVRTLAYHNSRRGIDIDLRLEGAGRGRATGGEPPDYRVDLLDLAAPAEVTFQVVGMNAPVTARGRATLTHTWTERSEAKVVQRRIDFSSLDAGDAVYLRQILSPEGKKTQWILVERAGRALYEASDVIVDVDDRPGEPTRGYPIPARLRVHGAAVSGSISLEPTLLEHDPLGALPQPFRFLLSFKMRPRRVWTDAPYSLAPDAAADRPAVEIAGHGIASVTYLNPLSPTAH
jgi:hypothetical protein